MEITKDFNIKGMTCGGCVRSVTMLLQKQPGVTHANVTLEPGKAELTYDDNLVTPQQLASVLAGMGYTMEV